ncbi:hypothetical protein [Paenibacillus paeoniae]|uniref:50S ribosomal protein L33 n=1 Tax=Paenibacillus paeoniae TaxID=2292705 RepID=A0A371PHL1_9BACL|nr:hypothetical protein [Paenibacillus paeoniae]REK75720.1 hypothetical protein DX130_01170 [Paenibacillus paeoniae]
MRKHVSRAQVRKLVGKSIYAMRKDGSVVSGKLVALRGNRLLMASNKGKGSKGKKVRTKAFFLLPLLLFDLLAIGTLPFWGGGFGYGGGFGGYGGGYGGGCGCGVPTCGGCGGNGGYPGGGGYFNGY